MPNFSAIIAGTGSCLPEKRLTNDDLSKMVDTNDEWITQRTGIKERRIAGPNESTATLAAGAARRALDAAGLVAADLGLASTPAFDVSAACSGFIYTLETAACFIKAGRYRNVLVIGA